MSQKPDPTRLLDPSSPADPLLREVLGLTSTSAPSAAELSALAIKVNAAVAVSAGSAAGAGAGAHSLWAKAGALKLSAALLAAGGVAFWGFHAQPRQEPTRAASPPTVGVAAPAVVPTEPTPEATGAAHARRAANVVPASATQLPAAPTQEPPSAPAAAVRVNAQSTAPTSTAQPTVHAKPALAAGHAMRAKLHSSASSANAAQPATRQADPADAVPEKPSTPVAVAMQPTASELTLLGRAQAALAHDAEATLEVLEAHARAYPHGDFVQEREALAIDALRRLGRRAEMEQRARAFLRDYPTSAHRDRIAGWLQ